MFNYLKNLKIGKYVILIFVLQIITFAAPLEVIFPKLSENATMDVYEVDVLKLILDKSGIAYKISMSDQVYSQQRVITELKSNSGKINITWIGTSKQSEEELVPVRYPLYRGLLGYRLFIINKDSQAKLSKVKSLNDLRKYQGIQGFGWSDVEILEYSGLKQSTAVYDNIFKMVNANRVDYFSRGIGEIFPEVESRKELKNLAVEQNILLVYPFAKFFFTNKENMELKNALEKGFMKAYADGSFEKFFYNHPTIKTMFKLANMESRVRIDIENPTLSKETKAIPEKYWHK